jgi:hypothetical protein
LFLEVFPHAPHTQICPGGASDEGMKSARLCSGEGSSVIVTRKYITGAGRAGILRAAHVREFGSCTGVVLGLTAYKSCLGPEIDVRWFPSGLRYAYHPDDLEIV